MPKVVLTETYIFQGKIFLPNEALDVPQEFLDNRKEGEYTLIDPPAPKAKKAPTIPPAAPTTPAGAGSDTPPTGAGSDTPPDGAGA